MEYILTQTKDIYLIYLNIYLNTLAELQQRIYRNICEKKPQKNDYEKPDEQKTNKRMRKKIKKNNY